jgi:hypothetical protein
MSNVLLPRRRLLGGAAALAAAQLPSKTCAQAADGWIPDRSGLSWASGVRDTAPDSFMEYQDRPIDVLVTYSKKATWAEIRASGGYNYTRLLGPPGNRPEVVVVSYPMFPLEQNPRDHGMGLWQRAASGEFDWAP